MPELTSVLPLLLVLTSGQLLLVLSSGQKDYSVWHPLRIWPFPVCSMTYTTENGTSSCAQACRNNANCTARDIDQLPKRVLRHIKQNNKFNVTAIGMCQSKLGYCQRDTDCLSGHVCLTTVIWKQNISRCACDVNATTSTCPENFECRTLTKGRGASCKRIPCNVSDNTATGNPLCPPMRLCNVTWGYPFCKIPPCNVTENTAMDNPWCPKMHVCKVKSNRKPRCEQIPCNVSANTPQGNPRCESPKQCVSGRKKTFCYKPACNVTENTATGNPKCHQGRICKRKKDWRGFIKEVCYRIKCKSNTAVRCPDNFTCRRHWCHLPKGECKKVLEDAFKKRHPR